MPTASKVTVFHRTSAQELHSYVVSQPEDDVYLVNEQRQAVLAEIDNAKFS